LLPFAHRPYNEPAFLLPAAYTVGRVQLKRDGTWWRTEGEIGEWSG